MHDRVTEVSRQFKNLLKYPFARTNELLAPAGALVQAVKGARNMAKSLADATAELLRPPIYVQMYASTSARRPPSERTTELPTPFTRCKHKWPTSSARTCE